VSSHVAVSHVVVSHVSVFLAVDGHSVLVRVRFRVWVSVEVGVSVRWIRRKVGLRVRIR